MRLPAPAPAPPPSSSPHEYLTCTIRSPPHSYVHLSLSTATPPPPPAGSASLPALDALQVRSYCAAALGQFLGLTGASIPVDVLAVRGTEAWVRVPRDDLGRFAASIAAWAGTAVDVAGGEAVGCVLRLRGCSDWLGSMLSREGQARLWRVDGAEGAEGVQEAERPAGVS